MRSGFDPESVTRSIRQIGAFMGLIQIAILGAWIFGDGSLSPGPNNLLFLAAAAALPNALCMLAMPQLASAREDTRGVLVGLATLSAVSLGVVAYGELDGPIVGAGVVFVILAAGSYVRAVRSAR